MDVSAITLVMPSSPGEGLNGSVKAYKKPDAETITALNSAFGEWTFPKTKWSAEESSPFYKVGSDNLQIKAEFLRNDFNGNSLRITVLPEDKTKGISAYLEDVPVSLIHVSGDQKVNGKVALMGTLSAHRKNKVTELYLISFNNLSKNGRYKLRFG